MTALKREQHGMARTPTYHTWAMMKQRCFNEKTAAHKKYGARGITVCERWRDSFAAFVADMGERPAGMSLGRIDNDGPYSPDNCRWESPKQQANNTRRTRRVMVDGEKRAAREVADEKGLNQGKVAGRLQSGWTIEQALELEPHHDPRAITVNGETMVIAQWARRIGLSRQAVFQRIENGWSCESAVTTPKSVSVGRTRPCGKSNNAEGTAGIFGRNLLRLRLERGMRQADLAKAIGVNTGTIAHYEAGKNQPNLETAVRIATFFSMTVDAFVTERGG